MITVTVAGDRGSGKTTVAMAVVAYLRSIGFDATYGGMNRDRTTKINSELDGLFDPAAACHAPKAVEVVDRT